MKRLEERSDGKYITSRKTFEPMGTIESGTIDLVFDFAYDMTFGNSGKHRDHRSGGTHRRRSGEVFANTFQGKLSEYAFYESVCEELDIEEPDLSAWELGIWDDTDFVAGDYKLNIKSTKSFGNLLLLETKDWNGRAQYLPNLEKGHADYDFFILIRMNPYCEELMKKNRILYSDDVEKEKLRCIVTSEIWEFDIAGWCSRNEVITAIEGSFVIGQGEMLNGKTRMDAENYYIQSGDMHDIHELINILKGSK